MKIRRWPHSHLHASPISGNLEEHGRYLVKRNINVPNCLCPVGGEDQESTEHLFVTWFHSNSMAFSITMVQVPSNLCVPGKRAS
ncbi:hypothetical protein HanXRQr2_Chr17g0816621 [Helianthus annuus]|uniref:Uncharacterized protein n=1 Tax=Helianthus annuus TaxID=4232 RepID=A0A251RSE0_HELAN|nr:hypothetical protein HanXRQr2_Chr17g0816621 [Helianthus annuus]KAJ0814325.1 hypothetical protein HanPSC8_Chr17g0784321 [Helianthus annuus]